MTPDEVSGDFELEYDDALRKLYISETLRHDQSELINRLQKRIENVLKYVGDDFEDFYEGEMVKGVHEILKGEWDD